MFTLPPILKIGITFTTLSFSGNSPLWNDKLIRLGIIGDKIRIEILITLMCISSTPGAEILSDFTREVISFQVVSEGLKSA